MDTINHFSFHLQLGNQCWSETSSSVALGFSFECWWCKRSWSLSSHLSNPGKMVFGTGNLKGGKLQKPALTHGWCCFPWSPSRDNSGRFPIFPEHEGSSARAGDSSLLHGHPVFIRETPGGVWVQGELKWTQCWAQDLGVSSRIAAKQNFVASGTKYWGFNSSCWVTQIIVGSLHQKIGH